MEKLYRNCPKCNTEISYKRKEIKERADEAQSLCKICTAKLNIQGVKKLSKLSEEQIDELCLLYEKGTKTKMLSLQYGLSQVRIQKILAQRQIKMRSSSSENKKFATEEDRKEYYTTVYQPKYREENSEKFKNQRKERTAQGKYKLPYRLGRYGLSLEEYMSILKEQNFCCPVCGKELIFKGRYPHTDHCHKTGKVRGILHNKCNVLLGFAEEDLDILNGAINYLRKHQV